MKTKTIKDLTYIAAFCFTLTAILHLLFPYYGSWLITLGSILVAISLITSLPMLSTIGFAVWIIQQVICIIFFWTPYSFRSLIPDLLSLSCYLLLVLASVKRKRAKVFSLAAAGIQVILFIPSIIYGWDLKIVLLYSVLPLLLFIASSVCLGIVYESSAKSA